MSVGLQESWTSQQTEALVLLQCDTQEDSCYFVKPGARRDIFLTASGRVLLAFQNEDELMRRLEKALAKSPGLMTEAEFLRRLKIVRLQGFEEMASPQISDFHISVSLCSTPAAMRSQR